MPQQPWNEARQVVAAIEAPCGLIEVALGAPAEFDRMVSAIDCALDVSKHGVYPLHCWLFRRKTWAALHDGVGMALIHSGIKHRKAIAIHLRSGLDVSAHKLIHSGFGKTGNGLHHHMPWPLVLSGADRDHEGLLVLRTSPRLAAHSPCSRVSSFPAPRRTERDY